MRVTMATVMSVDGRITQGDKVRASFWRSVEDGEILKSLIARHQVLIMGRKTYETVRPKPATHRLMIVLTSDMEQFASHEVPGSLEFVSEQPRQLISRLTARGYDSVLLLGGSSNIPFVEAGVVDELYLTVEPSLFGEGLPLAQGLPAAIPLRLVNSKQLNRQGTLLLRYEVIKRETPNVTGG
jgi:dihydrofolate reductase